MQHLSSNNIWLNRRFQAYAFGLMIDRFGNAVYALTLPLLVYHMTQSIINMSVMAIMQFIPRVVGSFFIGAIVDRYNRRNIIFIALIFQGFFSITIACLFDAQLLQIWMLYLFGSLVSIGFEFSRTAEIAIVPVMFEECRVEATTNLASVHTFMFMLGPIVAGGLLSVVSYNVLLWLNAISYSGPMVMNIWSKIPNEKNLGSISSFKEMKLTIKEGLLFIKNNPTLSSLVKITLIVGLSCSGIETIVIFYLKNKLNSSDTMVSALFSSAAAGMFVGSLLVSKYKSIDRQQFIFISLTITIVGLFLFLIEIKWILIIAQFTLSLGLFSYMVTKDILIQDIVPNKMLGRVNGMMRTLLFIVLPLSTAILAALANFAGVKSVFAFAILLILISLVWTYPTKKKKILKEP